MTIYYKTYKNGLPYLRKDDINKISEVILNKFNSKLLKEAAPTPIEELIENYFKLEMDYLDITKNRTILGLTTFDNGYLNVYDSENHRSRRVYEVKGTVVIDNSLLQNNQERRFRFTLRHEVSHWILHRQMFEADGNKMIELSNTAKNEVTAVKCLNRTIDNFAAGIKVVSNMSRMEWQANYMASCFLMPMKTFTKVTEKVFKKAGIKTSCIVLGIDSDIDMFAEYIPAELAKKFNVSARAAAIRLRELHLVRENTALLAIG